jgi:hypothetical protein
MGKLGQKRFDLGERLMPGAQGSVPGALLKDALQGSPTLPSEGAGLGFRTAKWRATQVGRRLAMPAQARTARRVGQILYDPKRALTDPAAQDWAMQGAQWAIKEHPEAVAAVGGVVAATQAMGAYRTFKTIKNLMTGGESDASGGEQKAATPYQPYQMPETQAIGLTQFHLDQTHATRVSRRQPNSTATITTSTDDSTMPSHIGPSDWYGPQGGYNAGRGFQQPEQQKPKMALPPLEQPQPSGSVLGV